MRRLLSLLAAGAVAASGMIATAPSQAAAFFGWQVTDVAAWDVLNVRAYPSSQSTILVGYPNGATLSLTGRCTEGLNLDAISHLPAWQQAEAVRFSWCETWVDPTGNGQFHSAWVYGRYIRPL